MRPLKRFALIAGLAMPLALGAEVATVATVEVVAGYYKPVHEGDRVVFLADPGEVNAVTMTQDGSVVVVRAARATTG